MHAFYEWEEKWLPLIPFLKKKTLHNDLIEENDIFLRRKAISYQFIFVLC